MRYRAFFKQTSSFFKKCSKNSFENQLRKKSIYLENQLKKMKISKKCPNIFVEHILRSIFSKMQFVTFLTLATGRYHFYGGWQHEFGFTNNWATNSVETIEGSLFVIKPPAQSELYFSASKFHLRGGWHSFSPVIRPRYKTFQK